MGKCGGDVYGRHGHLGLHHSRFVDPTVHVFGRTVRGRAELSADPGRLLSFALAVIRFAGSGRIFRLQTIRVRS